MKNNIENKLENRLETKEDVINLNPKRIIYIGDSEYQISAREKWVADTYIESVLSGRVNFSQIGRDLQERFGGKLIKGQHIRYWVERSRTSQYIKEKLKERLKTREFDADKWKAIGLSVLDGEIEMDSNKIAVWKELGKSVGVNEGIGVQINQQLNFTQKDGTV